MDLTQQLPRPTWPESPHTTPAPTDLARVSSDLTTTHHHPEDRSTLTLRTPAWLSVLTALRHGELPLP